MNNSFIAIENVSLAEDEKPQVNLAVLRAKETELMTIIEAVMRLSNNPDWLIMKDKVWDGVVETLLKRRDIEVVKKPLNGPEIHGINGQLLWAKKFSNIVDLANIYKQELTKVRNLINAESRTTNRR